MVCLSPTGTTKTVLQAMAEGINHPNTQIIDITTPKARQQSLETNEDDLLVVGVPVYMGRVPALLSDWLRAVKAIQTPAIAVVVYGNRAYENALLELSDALKKAGCILIAGAAFIGEHSFSSPEMPSSVGRPDATDIDAALAFGRQIGKKLNDLQSLKETGKPAIPGLYPYGGTTNLWKLDFIATSEACTQCGSCAAGCPTGAIDPDNSRLIDIEKCTLCCACIRHCPEKARTIKQGPMKEAAIRCTLFLDRKEPELFL